MGQIACPGLNIHLPLLGKTTQQEYLKTE